MPRRAGEDELEEELVAKPGGGRRSCDPARERLAAGVGERVDALLARVAGHVLAVDEAVALEPLQGRVHLAGVERRERGAEPLLELLLQLVAVRGARRQ